MSMRAGGLNRGVTLVELLVVMVVIAMLAAMLMPAVNAARESARKSQCQSNLRQFSIAMLARSERGGYLCSGAFDWRNDGCVTDIGWVADLVREEVPVGDMLCPTNPHKVSEAYNDLLEMNPITSNCVNRLGRSSMTLPDGTTVANPCRTIAQKGLPPGSEQRRLLVEQEVFDRKYNTNYTASWFLVRTGVLLDSSGNLRSVKRGCGASLKSRNSTIGPLKLADLDSADAPLTMVPLMGCGQPVGTLSQTIGPYAAGHLVVKSFTDGPVLSMNTNAPKFPQGTARTGATGWWAVWVRQTLQDYRGFAPVHRHSSNVLFADGSVRLLHDINKDGFLNNGFGPSSGGGFADAEIEIDPKDVLSGYSLDAPIALRN